MKNHSVERFAFVWSSFFPKSRNLVTGTGYSEGLLAFIGWLCKGNVLEVVQIFQSLKTEELLFT